MSYYLYDINTGEFKGVSPVEINQIFIGCTDIAPTVQPGPHQVLIFDRNHNKWLVADDYRGTWWNKTDPSKVIVISDIGVKVDTTQYTDKPPCQFCKWDETSQSWKFDLDFYKDHTIALMRSQVFSHKITTRYLYQLIYKVVTICRRYLSFRMNPEDNEKELLYNDILDIDSYYKQIQSLLDLLQSSIAQIESSSTKDQVDTIYQNFLQKLKTINLGESDDTNSAS